MQRLKQENAVATVVNTISFFKYLGLFGKGQPFFVDNSIKNCIFANCTRFFEKMPNRYKLFIFVLLSLFGGGCAGLKYSATGADIPAEAKTITIKPFQNNAALVYLQLSNELTTQLQDKFRRNTRLSLVDARGDLYIEGEITGYSVSSAAVGADRATMNRLTISIRIHYENKFDEKKNKDLTFSRYLDFSATQSLQEVQDGLVREICTVLVDDIFAGTVGDW